MAQPVKHTPDSILDAARGLILAGGPAAASTRAVSRASGAPSGSLYHRFANRDDLLVAVWLRAQDRFLAAYLDRLSATGTEAGVAAAVIVLSWSLSHRPDASILLTYSLRDLGGDGLSPGLAEHAAANRRRLSRGICEFAARAGLPITDVTVAVVDLPYAVTRRVLSGGRTDITKETAALARAAALLLGTPVTIP